MFKRYRRDGELLYREAWAGDGVVVEHWGRVGTEGRTFEHHAKDGEAASRVLEQLQRQAEDEGYTEIDLDDHFCLVARKKIDGFFGTEGDLELRFELQEQLDQRLGWLGLGCCDGGDIGSGEMAVFSFVVDLEEGLKALSWVLARPPGFDGFYVEVQTDED